MDHRLHVELRGQLLAAKHLIGRHPPFGVEHLIQRAKLLLRSAVTFKAPLHQERSLLTNKLHLIDLTVATCAANALFHMHGMIEVHVIGQAMHAVPTDGLVVLIAFTNRGEQLGADPNLFMAVHARLGGWHARIGGGLDRSVAISAIDAQSRYVLLMAEGDGLIANDPGIGDVTGSHKDGDGRPRTGQQKDCPEDSHLRDRVETTMENLGQRAALRLV